MDEERDRPEAAIAHDGELRNRISGRMVQLLKEFYGKGPTKAKAYYYDDTVLVLTRGGFTRVEQTLLDQGKGESVITQRSDFQAVMRDRFTDVIEEETGRRVVAFLSATHQDPDVSAEVFILDSTELFSDADPG